MIVKLVDLLSVLSISLSQIMELIFEVLLLSKELSIEILVLVQVTLQSRDFNVSVVQAVFLGIKLSVKVRILLFPVYEEVLLIINFLSQSLNHVDVNFNSASVVLFHSSLVIGYSVEILLQTK
mgnify:CR=1 FL=1